MPLKLQEGESKQGGTEVWDPEGAALRIEELEVGVATALRINTLVNQEVERHVVSSDQLLVERDAWKGHAQHLAGRLDALRRKKITMVTAPAAAAAPSGGKEEEQGDDTRGRGGVMMEELSMEEALKVDVRGEADRSAKALADYLVICMPPGGEEQAGITSSSTASAAAAAAQQHAKKEKERAEMDASMPVEPTPQQSRAMTALLARGREAGWIIDPSEVTLGSPLGQGEFGTTYLGRWRGAEVAVKCVRVSKPSELTTFIREVEAMSLLRHPNVVPFLGACLCPPDKFWLLAEFMPRGTLDGWLRGRGAGGAKLTKPGGATGGVRDGTTTYTTPAGGGGGGGGPTRRSLAQRARICLEVAQGMEALHSCHPTPIMHRDLKPTNIFVDAGGHARIGDFGFARRLLPGESRADLTGETGTYLYMAPELMRHEVYTRKVDVWSWGVMFAELMEGSCTPPYSHLFLTPVQVGLAVAQEQLQPNIPETLSTDLQVLGRMACQFDPDIRPSFKEIIEELTPQVEHLLHSQEGAGGGGGGGGGAGGGGIVGTLNSMSAAWGGIMGRAIYGNGGTGTTSAGGAEEGGGRPSTSSGRSAEAKARVKARREAALARLKLKRLQEEGAGAEGKGGEGGRRQPDMLNSAADKLGLKGGGSFPKAS